MQVGVFASAAYTIRRQGAIKHTWNEVVVCSKLYIVDAFFHPRIIITSTDASAEEAGLWKGLLTAGAAAARSTLGGSGHVRYGDRRGGSVRTRIQWGNYWL